MAISLGAKELLHLVNINVVRDFSLTTKTKDKMEATAKYARVTVFVNKAHTLAHVFYPGEEHCMLRIFGLPGKHLKKYSNKALQSWFVRNFAHKL